jgi:predicted  nucleic acid-binding Zn-ribbon protein
MLIGRFAIRNTLKYANRARNIKNRAEINEVEVGWDDVDYLQNLVVKLRGELASLRNGNTPMRTITEERRASMPANDSKLLELQQDHAELSQKYAVLTAEVTKYRQHTQAAGLSPDEFAKTVEPVVEHYETAISAIESQLSLTRAALAHSEDAMREQDDRLAFEHQINETNSGVIGELKSKVARLAEREAVTESYIKDLENRLKSTTDEGDTNLAVVVDLRKDLAKYRDSEANSERYIRDLEVRLAKSDGAVSSLTAQVEALERDVARREEAYKDLESRLALLDTGSDNKLLLEELDEREKRVLELERNLDDVKVRGRNVTLRALESTHF